MKPQDEPGRKRRRRRWYVPAAFALLAILYCLWALFWPHSTVVSDPVPREQAAGCPIPLPASAKNIRYATFYQWNFWAEYVRFEAPPADCVAHVPVVLADWRKTFPKDKYPDPEPLTDLAEPPRPVRSDLLDLSWFDVHRIRQGKRCAGTLAPTIWIDTERGVFYFAYTD